jgi:hypothetical protein
MGYWSKLIAKATILVVLAICILIGVVDVYRPKFGFSPRIVIEAPSSKPDKFSAVASPLPAIVQRTMQLDEECRGGQHDPDDASCVARDRSFDQAKEAGWCYGRDGDTEAERVWHPCTS